MKKLGLTCFGISLFMFALGPILWITFSQKRYEEISEEDKQLRRIVRSLNSIQEKIDNNLIIQRKETDAIIQSKLPWLPKHRTMPNYYLKSEKAPSIDSGKYSSNSYHDSSLVFIHVPRAAGSQLIKCLNNISYSFNLPMSPSMNIQNRILWDAGNPDTNAFRDLIKIHRGKYSFGMCENLEHKCAYFIMLREPFNRAVSSYKYCQSESAYLDEQCGAMNANALSLKEWIIEQGSPLFNQIVFSPNFCSEKDFSNFSLLEHRSQNLVNVKKIPCWYKQKVLLEKTLTPLEKVHVTNYIIDNLQTWFSVIGLFEEIDVSLKLFNHVFNLPFTDFYDVNRTSSEIDENITSNSARSSNENRQLQTTEYDEFNEMEYIENDDYVNEALSSDYRIYKEAKRIFHIQKQVLFNTIAS